MDFEQTPEEIKRLLNELLKDNHVITSIKKYYVDKYNLSPYEASKKFEKDYKI